MERYSHLEERALTNYFKEVQLVSEHNFVFGSALHPTDIQMYLDPRYYIGQASAAAKQQA